MIWLQQHYAKALMLAVVVVVEAIVIASKGRL